MPLSIRKLGQSFAAEIRGVDLRQPLTQARLDEIYDAFLKYRVVILPGQALSQDEQLRFAQTFGPLFALEKANPKQHRVKAPELDDVSNLDAGGDLAGSNSVKAMFALGNRLWHSDLSFCENPAHASMLHALEIAQDGGETQFCDLVNAYQTLDDETKQTIEPLIAGHSLAHSRIQGGAHDLDLEYLKKIRPPSQQPVVRIHPETGDKVLFVGAHIYKIEGMDDSEASALVDRLIAHATQPDNIYSHRWAVHDLIIWDNRQVLHRGRPYDVDNVRRVMHRATVNGDGATVINGQAVAPTIKRRAVKVA